METNCHATLGRDLQKRGREVGWIPDGEKRMDDSKARGGVAP